MNTQTEAKPTEQKTKHLRDAEQILADLNALSDRLMKLAPKNLAFYAVNRAWRNMREAVEYLKELP